MAATAFAIIGVLKTLSDLPCLKNVQGVNDLKDAVNDPKNSEAVNKFFEDVKGKIQGTEQFKNNVVDVFKQAKDELSKGNYLQSASTFVDALQKTWNEFKSDTNTLPKELSGFVQQEEEKEEKK